MARPVRTFTGQEGQRSAGSAGPDAIKRDLDFALKMFNPDETLPDGGPGGIDATENIRLITVDQGEVPSEDTGNIAELLSWITNRLKAITGTNDWKTSPPKTLSNIWETISGYEIPVGMIAMWSGSIANIPSGWALCNGSNGTPDLRDRFIVGAGSSYAVGNTGGSASVTLTTAQLPSHSHTASTNSTGSHSHTGSTNTTGAHTHTYENEGWSASVAKQVFSISDEGAPSTKNTSSAGDHSHSFTTESAGSHTHTVTVSNTGGGGSHENRPPYYALAYIMKT